MGDLSKRPVDPIPVDRLPVELLGDTFVHCGCGFVACSNNQAMNVGAYEEHICPLAPQRTTDWKKDLPEAAVLIVFILIVGLLAWKRAWFS